MSIQQITGRFKEFMPTTWSIKNKTSIYLLMLFVSLGGIYQFVTLPKEQFPDIVIPTIFVQTVYVGNSPKDIENLVTRPLEKQIKGITGAKIKKFTSTSQQDFSAIQIEFDTDVKTDIALQKIKDAIDKAKHDLPKDLTQEPTALEISLSEQPIMYVNLSGDYDLTRLKKFADDLKDRLENLKQINRVEIVGAPEREFQINVDNYRMQSAGVTFDDITNTIKRENMDISGGLLEVGDMRRNLQIKGQLKSATDIASLIVRNQTGSPVYLKDIATIIDTTKEKESYARLNGKNVVTLNIIKRNGENLIESSDGVKEIVETTKAAVFPKDLDVVITGDQSIKTRTSFNELVNSIIIGFVLVLIVLMFFMGVVNAFFVALSVPLSMFVAFVFLPAADLIVGSHVTLNFIVLFALLFGLGIIVDDAIVVIENTHRIFIQGKGRIPTGIAARMAAGEVFIPVLAGTVTTLAPFFVGVIGGILLDLFGFPFAGNLLLFFMLLWILNRYVLSDAIATFQQKVLPSIMNKYENLLRWALKGWRPVHLLLGTIALLFVSLFLFIGSYKIGRTGIVLFPEGDPNQIYVYLKLPVGMDVKYTDSITRELANRVNKVLGIGNGNTNPLVESVISNVAVGAGDPVMGDRSTRSELGRLQISFVEFEKRHGVSTKPYLDSIRKVMKGIPGAEFSVDQENSGPPTDPPINIEIACEDFNQLVIGATGLKNYLDSIQVPGVEELKMDVDLNNPEITFTINRQRALIEGVSTAQIGQQIRTALFGLEVSKIKEGKDEYKIQLRTNSVQRKNLTDLLNMKISFRDMAAGGAVKNIPISALVDIEPTSTLGSVKRKDQKRLITLRSNVLTNEGYDATGVNQVLEKYIANYKKLPEGVTVKQTGEGEQQAETGAFLLKALLIALMLILFTLVLQFNSISKSVIILTEIIFSVIGVFIGYAITGMDFSILMTGLGIVGLAGIVVKNGILVIEFTDELRGRGMKTREAAIQAGKTRIIPVMLTAVAAILAFIPIAVGFNINFVTLFSELNPHIFFGGDNVAFWRPLSWTIIFGLAFAFFMTLIIVPAMYLIAERLRRPMQRMFGGKWISMLGIPPLTLLFLPLMVVALLSHRIKRKRRAEKFAKNPHVNELFIGSWF